MCMHKHYGCVVMPTSADKVVWHCFLVTDVFAWLCCWCWHHGIWNAKKYLGFIINRMTQPFSSSYMTQLELVYNKGIGVRLRQVAKMMSAPTNCPFKLETAVNRRAVFFINVSHSPCKKIQPHGKVVFNALIELNDLYIFQLIELAVYYRRDTESSLFRQWDWKFKILPSFQKSQTLIWKHVWLEPSIIILK